MNADKASSRLDRWSLAPLIVAVVTAAVYLPILENGFVKWDDWRDVIANPSYRGLGWAQLRWMFTSSVFCKYQPIGLVSLGLDFMVWAMRPFGYHLTSVFFHCANAAAFYFLCLALQSRGKATAADSLGAGFAALLFSLHPLRVEPVAWVSARGDVICGLFFILTLLSWLRAARPGEGHRRRWIVAALFFYLLSLLSKAVTVTLPAVLIVLDVYPLKRLPLSARRWFHPSLRGLWLEKAPFVALALVFAIVNAGAQAQCGAVLSLERSGVGARTIHVLFGSLFYLGKTLWPSHLSPLYETNAQSYAATLILGGAALAAACALGCVRRFRPAVWASLTYYFITLSPVLAVQLGRQRAADRYSYLPCLAWALLGGAAWKNLSRDGGRPGAARAVSAGLAGALAVAMLCALCVQTRRQGEVWRDSSTLWRTVLRRDVHNGVARANLAEFLLEQGRVGEAVLYLEEQVRLFPADPYSRERLATIVSVLGVTRRDHARFHGDLGLENARRGDWEKAVWHYRKALDYAPESRDISSKLESALSRISPGEK